jgi:hypothetical protein
MTSRAQRKHEILSLPGMEDFKPTMQRPLPAFQCVGIVEETGERCRNYGKRGMTPETSRCVGHGGNNPDMREKAEARVEAARLKVWNSTEKAADVLEALLEPGTTEGIRLKAATEVLDRGGIRAGVELDLGVEVNVNHGDEVRERLANLALGRYALEADEDEDEDIVEADIVEETDE